MEVARLPVADGDHVVRAEEDQDLAELDHLPSVDVAGGLQHHEQHVAVDLELGSLVALIASSTASSCRSNSALIDLNSASVGSNVPIQTKASGERQAS